MLTVFSSLRSFSALLAVAMIVLPAGAAASARSSPQTPFHRAGIVYVSDHQTQQIFEFPAGVPNPKPIGTISNGLVRPDGLWVTSNGDLYVANGPNLVAYHRGASMPFRQLSISPATESATDVVVDRLGRVYAILSDGLNGRVDEYDPGHTAPTRIIRLPFPRKADYVGIAVANGGEEFFTTYNVIGLYTEYGDVERFHRNGDTPTFLGLNLATPYGIAFDSKRDLVVVDNGYYAITSTRLEFEHRTRRS